MPSDHATQTLLEADLLARLETHNPRLWSADALERQITAAEATMFTLRSEARDRVNRALRPWREALREALDDGA